MAGSRSAGSGKEEDAMKSIGVVTQQKSPLAQFLKENVGQIFRGYASVNNYYFSDLLSDAIVSDDCVLVMSSEKVGNMRQYVPDIKRIVVVQRTIREPELNKIAAIPANTKVLVVNNDAAMTLETIALLYQLGINHLDLVPFETGHDYNEIVIAVTPGESELVPSYIQTVIDVGNRCLDFRHYSNSTRLGLDDWEIHQRLIQCLKTFLTLDLGLKKQHRDFFHKNLN